MKEIDELIEGAHPEIVALDATCRVRPDGRTLDELYADIRAKYPEQKINGRLLYLRRVSTCSPI